MNLAASHSFVNIYQETNFPTALIVILKPEQCLPVKNACFNIVPIILQLSYGVKYNYEYHSQETVQNTLTFRFTFGVIVLYFLYLVAYLSSYHEKAINALYELAYELPAIYLPL